MDILRQSKPLQMQEEVIEAEFDRHLYRRHTFPTLVWRRGREMNCVM